MKYVCFLNALTLQRKESNQRLIFYSAATQAVELMESNSSKLAIHSVEDADQSFAALEGSDPAVL
ncbi:hypothetical protein O9929_17635 [Vibrio lentus]|nr:hypothetical protein [Vibrio lentus]